ncbi:hypothetical protein [Amycolatopsis sp. PS_44_ISF1]|uniref:hypothetical protein n=1 Tax=Amycolatopsis sp. PS_44_ISF1 TaxID=2974917 RepID=UPI0028E04BDA|nr:hypothetical protein [Amycolatopsis sp. PS_44_ISF1]MDT8913154.1 hypothetical protein [Amycolatopsis sp. PS_44_ISF1]
MGHRARPGSARLVDDVCAGLGMERLALPKPPVVLLGEVLDPMLWSCRRALAPGRPKDAARTALAVS